MIKTILNAVTAPGYGESLTWPVSSIPNIWDLLLQVNPNHSVQVNTTGSPTAVTLDLEGSLDGVENHFQPMQSHTFTPDEIIAGFAIFVLRDTPMEYVRLNLKVLTGGVDPTVTGIYLGFECKRIN